MALSAARGKKRISAVESLPYLDKGSEIHYEGSISKCGDNADWDWGMYQDENGEWVLMEADGPGCIFNFTQHRYPTSPVPVFRFYFDFSDIPQFEITPEEFGSKKPFLKPLADIFEGPEDNGKGPIWVVRSFVPMEFCTHCKVTSSIKLEGAEKDKGEGGWGHITYHLYDSDSALKTFSPDDTLYNIGRTTANYATETDGLYISSYGSEVVFEENTVGTLTQISVSCDCFTPELLNNLWIKLYFDDEINPKVEAPFGTFFGCEYGYAPAEIKTAMLACCFKENKAYFENSFPMPYFEYCRVELINRSNNGILFNRVNIGKNNKYKYNKADIGYFTSSKYYEKTKNTPGRNSVIADVKGFGAMVYGVISGYDIGCGCEGDVRVFIDGKNSPAVESDGSESWGSYGWGFVCPPQWNPFSAYNGVYGINDTWSELRLTFTDSYTFLSELRFELEHGCQNDGGGFHSGQIFFYMQPQPCEEYICTLSSGAVGYVTDGTKIKIKNRFENGIHEDYKSFECVRGIKKTMLQFNIPSQNSGVVLKRVSIQSNGAQTASVYVDKIKVYERKWFFPDSNQIYSLLEDSYMIPSRYTAGKEKLTVEIIPENENWSECQYCVFVLKQNQEKNYAKHQCKA